MSLKLNSRERPKSTGGCIGDEAEKPIKLVMVGDSGVGKSCLLDKFLDDSSTNNFISTIGVDIRSRETKIQDKTVKLQVRAEGSFGFMSVKQEPKTVQRRRLSTLPILVSLL